MGKTITTPVHEMEQIMQKIRKIEQAKDFFNRALRARVCPKCGETLQKEVGDFFDDIPGNEIEYICTSCDFTYKTDTQRKDEDFYI